MVSYYNDDGNYIGDQPDPPKKKAKTPKKKGKFNADKVSGALGSLSEIAAQLGGKGLQGYSPDATPVGKGAASSIQYTNLDQEVDTQQAKIRKQIEALKA